MSEVRMTDEQIEAAMDALVQLCIQEMLGLEGETCPYCRRPGNGEPCTPYCGAAEEAV